VNPRSSWIAAIFSIIALGGGHLYVGRARRFFVAVVILLSIWTTLTLGGFLSTFIGFAIGEVSLLLFFLFVPIDPAIIAFRTPIPVRRWYMKKSTYIAYLILVPLLIGGIKNHVFQSTFQADVLGYGLHDVGTDSMAPTVLAGDYVLVDTKYYQKHPPSVGDVIIARPFGKENTLVRRIRVVSGTNIWVSADKGWSASSDMLNNAEISAHNIEGRVTYIAFSRKSISRIGTEVIGHNPSDFDSFLFHAPAD
jgi:signal peptidase I